MKFKRPHLHVSDGEEKESSIWINEDIRPLPPSRRLWTKTTYISFWAINQICISNWQQGSSLVSSGLSVWQTMISIIIGKLIIAAVAILNGYVGAEWHIGFPVVSRMVWGVYGAYFQVVQRVVLSLVWFAVQSWTGPLLSAPAKAMSGTDLGWKIVQGVTTTIGGIAVGLSNQMDYCRFSRRPGDQVFGQWFSILLFGSIFPLFGCLTSSATQKNYGEAIWNPPLVVQAWLDTDYNAKSRAGAFFAGVGLVICQIAINSVDNAYSTGMDLAGLLPRWINIRRGAYIGLVLSIAMCPWELLSSAATFISVLSAYSVFLGPLIGIHICDYWVIRQRRIKLSDLYHGRPDGFFHYWHGINPRAFIAWACGFASQLPGFANAINKKITVPVGCVRLYYLAFLVGFAISFSIFYVLSMVWPPEGVQEIDEVDIFGTFSEDEAFGMGTAPRDHVFRREVDYSCKDENRVEAKAVEF
ncbi:hypothetical protein BLS_009686 [Venturia inaequalis]|uniref:Uracil permease n=1 Tax=Venturia inaequalis TaxID=5025 RepID=A0A8H3YJR5_VENIN|nr:hypothetical protein BLS_009686 [Venturia inaequalis]KAE9976709.1 hypothetical protein EG328_002424 [Venturia inaequalis]